MSNTSGGSSGSGIGFIGLLTLIFITLKLTGHIDWSWWWITSPIWIGLPAIFLIALAVFLILIIIDEKKGR